MANGLISILQIVNFPFFDGNVQFVFMLNNFKDTHKLAPEILIKIMFLCHTLFQGGKH